jgi:hypothetical protein
MIDTRIDVECNNIFFLLLNIATQKPKRCNPIVSIRCVKILIKILVYPQRLRPHILD